MTSALLLQKNILGKGEAFHFSRSVLTRARPKALHDQDFYEILWVHNGRAILHTSEGRIHLQEGDVVFVSPAFFHAIQGLGDECHVVNVILRRKTLKDIFARHPEVAQIFPQKGAPPRRVHRDVKQLARLSVAAKALEAAPRHGLYLEAFLFPLVAELISEDKNIIDAAPDWLSRALTAAESPDIFRQGASGFVAQCGKAHAHVSRVMQTHLGQTPSEFINTKRMEYAARQLKGTPDSLAEIAADIGITNMSHFHRLFRARYDMTPRQYRIKHQKGVIQPV